MQLSSSLKSSTANCAAGMVQEDGLAYLPGFDNDFSSEALPDALPKGQNTPQVCPYGLYAEQLSGSAFTEPRGITGLKRTYVFSNRCLGRARAIICIGCLPIARAYSAPDFAFALFSYLTPVISPHDVHTRSWFYRIRPSVVHPPFKPMEKKPMTKKGDWPAPEMTTRWDDWAPNPNQLRWLPFKLPTADEVRTYTQNDPRVPSLYIMLIEHAAAFCSLS